MRDLAVSNGKRGAIEFELFGGEVDEQLAAGGGDAADLGDGAGGGLAAGGAAVVGNEVGVGENDADGFRFDAEFFGGGLSYGSADVLADFSLAAVEGNLAIFGDMQPATDLLRLVSRAAATAASASL